MYSGSKFSLFVKEMLHTGARWSRRKKATCWSVYLRLAYILYIKKDTSHFHRFWNLQICMRSLKTRRVALITSFSKKAFSHEKFKGWFSESEDRTAGARTRGRPIPRLKPVACRTQRYKRSSLPLMTKLLSWYPPMRYFGLDLAWDGRCRPSYCNIILCNMLLPLPPPLFALLCWLLWKGLYDYQVLLPQQHSHIKTDIYNHLTKIYTVHIYIR